MPFYLYIIQSQKDSSYYVGTTADLSERIERHNQGRSKFTKHKRPWKLVYTEKHPDRSSAMKREYAVKRRKSTQYIKKCIGQWDFSITLLAKDQEELREIIIDIKKNLGKVLDSYKILLLYEEYKNTYFPEGIGF